MGARVQVEAGSRNLERRQAAAVTRTRSGDKLMLDLWRQIIAGAVADAKRTFAGVPTGVAVLSRWWIEEYKPAKTDRANWPMSFECVCEWLKIDPSATRKRLVAEIERTLRKKAWEYARSAWYEKRAQVLTCAGVPTAIARQLSLGVVQAGEYDEVAGVDTVERPGQWHEGRELFEDADTTPRAA